MGKRVKRCTLVSMLLICKSLSWKSPCLLPTAARNAFFSFSNRGCLFCDSRFAVLEEDGDMNFPVLLERGSLEEWAKSRRASGLPLSAGVGAFRREAEASCQVSVPGISD